ncbi:MAG: hypothetical protein AB7K71_40975 [Polyangiaceae bacterium]
MPRWLLLGGLFVAVACNSIAGIDDLEPAASDAGDTADAAAGSGGGGLGGDAGDANADPLVCNVDQTITVDEGQTATLGAACVGGTNVRYAWPTLGGWLQGDGSAGKASYGSGDEYGVRTGQVLVTSDSQQLPFSLSVSVRQLLDDPGVASRSPVRWWGTTAQTNWNSQPAPGDNTSAVLAADGSYSTNQASFAVGDFVAAQFDTEADALVPPDAGDIRVSVQLRVFVCSAAAPRLFARLLNTAVQDSASSLELNDVNCSGNWETLVATWPTNPFAPGPWTPEAVNGALGVGWVVNPRGPGVMGPDTVRVDYVSVSIDYAR